MQIHFFNNENLKETKDFQDRQIVGVLRRCGRIFPQR